MQARVWNDNDHPHKEKFKGEDIVIPPHKFVEMEFYEAYEFKGRMTPIKYDGNNVQTPQSYKMIRVEPIAEGAAASAPETHTCLACNKSHATKAELEAHTDMEHLDVLADQELAQKRRGRPRKEA
jgi:hypothetical protein